eukprot:CAMPEP_0114662658 /NCGR_PEP_ID=MMETSP0191-20121206/25276_1 /TAXON_ID=126664 /ORGANISM="Sorites sp." /LENGTH=419 /DNA_ID=CAMNT_0001899517 /DNA_START=168 /DNA_END=1427 /DNA_ORIENTATION=+
MSHLDVELPVESLDEPPRPKVPPRFRADTKVATVAPGGMSSVGPGVFAQDVTEKALWQQETRSYPFGTQYFAQLLLANSSFDITGGNQSICRQLPMFGLQRFVDIFSWASNPQLSEYVGERTVAGKKCSQWQLRSPNHSLSLCADGNIPVEFNTSHATTGIPGTSSYQFGTVVIGDQVPESLFQEPLECKEFAPPCESGLGKAPVDLDAFVFHPSMSPADYNIEDQDIADVEGDAFFICGDRLQGNGSSQIDHNYTLISRYALQISPAFGQYAVCNGYPDTTPAGPSCIGGDPRLVGKEAPFFVGEGESRCATESISGFWYSLPKQGHCPDGQSPSATAGTSGCTWSIQKRLKTIQQKCLLDTHHFLDLCKADFVEKKGFPRSVAALHAAFESEDLASGGCPDVGGPKSSRVEDFAMVV